MADGLMEELKAMTDIAGILEGFDAPAQQRIMQFLGKRVLSTTPTGNIAQGGASMISTAEEFVRSKGGPTRLSDIVEHIRAADPRYKNSTNENVRNNLAPALARSDKFKRVEQGVYTLVEFDAEEQG
jgi:hypothetical protein